MTTILIAQAAYVLFGMLFNVVSIWRERAGLTRLTPTNPSRGFRSMAIAAVITAGYFLLPVWIYVAGWLVLASLIAKRAVWKHYRAIAITRNLDGYASPASARLALAINAVGCLSGVLATAALFN